MSNTPQATSGPSQWVKNNPLVTITILGILLYVVLSVPITFFYARLGTSPGEVGFTYASILSGSTLAALAIVAIIIASLAVLIFFIGYGIIIGFSTFLVIALIAMIRNHSVLRSKDQELDDEQFARKLKVLKLVYADNSGWTEVGRALQRKRKLAQLETRTPAEESEATNLSLRYSYSDIYRRLYPSLPKTSSSWRAVLMGGFLLLTIAGTTGALTYFANENANAVRDGQSFSSSNLNVFDYHAEPVKVVPASADYASQVNQVIPSGKPVFLLGQNAQNVILYVPHAGPSGDGSTVRIPASEVIIRYEP